SRRIPGSWASHLFMQTGMALPGPASTHGRPLWHGYLEEIALQLSLFKCLKGVAVQRQKTSAAQLPVLDENTLQQLLGAAWVMQEHNDRLLAQQSTASPSQKSGLLAEIV